MNTRASPGTRKAAQRARPFVDTRVGSIQWMLRDPVILSALLLSVVVVLYQFVVLVLRPAWLEEATAWLRAGLGWAELACVALASIALSHARRPGALAWWFLTAGIASYTIAETSQVWLAQMAAPGASDTPSWAALIALLQYPFFLLALAFLPGVSRRGQPGMSRAKVVLDSLLLMAAGTALSWYFFLAPIYLQSGQSALGKATNLASPVGDLGLLFGLAVVVARQGPREAGRLTIHILIAAVTCLIIADSWYAYLGLYTMDAAGAPISLFWVASYLLFGLAGLARFRIARQEARIARGRSHSDSGAYALGPQAAGPLQLLLPFMAALLASALILVRVAVAPTRATSDLSIPFAVSFGLIVLVMLRQGITVLENERLLRNEQRRGEELALAHQFVQHQRQQLAERNQWLERDITHLKEVHARVARGDYTARAHIERGELLPIAGSLNLMLDRLANLSRVNTEYGRLDHAAQQVLAAAQGLVMGNERLLDALTAPTNTVLDGVVMALSQLRTRVNEMGMGLQQLDLARKAARELTGIAVQQGQFITNEAAALVGTASGFSRLAAELEHAAQLLEQHMGAPTPENRPLAQVVGLLRLLVRLARQHQAEAEAQALRFAQAEGRAGIAAIGGRRLTAELDLAARSGGSRVTMSMPPLPVAHDALDQLADGDHAADTPAPADSHPSDEMSEAVEDDDLLDKKPTAPLSSTIIPAQPSQQP